MKIKYTQLFALLMILLISVSICSAQDAITIQISKDGNFVDIKDALVEQNGKKVLLISENETVKFRLEGDVKFESQNPNSVVVLNNKNLKGVAADTEAVIVVKKDGAVLNINGLEENKFTVRVQDADANRQVVAQSTFLPYKTVRDNFGKKFAKSYFVIQVDIRNEKLNQQFIVQTLDVIIDPNQCYNGRVLYEGFDAGKCIEIFKEYFIFPNAQQGIRREEMIASGKADLNRSKRNVGFRILAFAAGMGTILTGFNGVLGPDGVKGVNVLGTTVTAAANGLFPDTADEKLENLKNALPTEDVIIKSKESKTFNIFIPTERVFYNKSWKEYIKPARDSSKETYTLKAVLDLLLLSSATGVLVANDAPKVQVKSDDNLRRQTQKFALVGGFSDEETKRTDEFFDTIVTLNNKLSNESDRTSITMATGLLRTIVTELRKTPRFNSFLGNSVDDNSSGKLILEKIKALSADLATNNRDEVLIAEFQKTVIKFGK